jgi:small-conductance mechanosensitive channel
LNFERPFKVGDEIKINNIVGNVKDITWRTTRVESRDGQMVSLANGKVTEAFMENYSQSANGLVDEVHFYTTVDTNPNTVLSIITEANEQAKSILRKKAPKAGFKGVVNIEGFWVNDFTSKYYVENLSAKS